MHSPIYVFVTGHDFSRAEKAYEIDRALAPEGGFRRDERHSVYFGRRLAARHVHRFIHLTHGFSRAALGADAAGANDLHGLRS